MMKRTAMTILTGFVLLAVTTTFAQTPAPVPAPTAPTAPSAPQTTAPTPAPAPTAGAPKAEDAMKGGTHEMKGNKGGKKRGLGRADEAAGEHGKKGRDNARGKHGRD